MGGSKDLCLCLGIRTCPLKRVCAHACLLTLLQGQCGEFRQTWHAFFVGAGWVQDDGWNLQTIFTNISAGGISAWKSCFCFSVPVWRFCKLGFLVERTTRCLETELVWGGSGFSCSHELLPFEWWVGFWFMGWHPTGFVFVCWDIKTLE